MSNHLVSEVHKRKLGSLPRMAVMALLADKASDDGSGIWASKQTMADELDTTKPTVRAAIQGLIADGLLKEVGQRPCQAGYTVEYAIQVAALRALPLVPAHREKGSSNLTGKAALPVKPVDRSKSFTGQAPNREGSRSFTQTSLEPINNNPPTPRAGGRKKRSQISDDWKAPALADLPPAAQAAAAAWPAGAYEGQAEAFAAWYRGRGRGAADWNDLWAAWIAQKHPAVMRDAKSGTGYTAPPAASAGTTPSAPKAETAAKSREDGRSADLHDVLRDLVGAAQWESWWRPMALILDDDCLMIVAPAPFHRQYLEERHGQTVQAALAALGWNVEHIRWDVKPPKKGASR